MTCLFSEGGRLHSSGPTSCDICLTVIVSPVGPCVRTALKLTTHQQGDALNTAAGRISSISVWSRPFLLKKYRKGKEKSWMVTELNRTVKAYPVSLQHDASIPWFIVTVPRRWFYRTDFTDWIGSFRYFVLWWDASLHEVGNVKEYRGVRVCPSICPHLVCTHWTVIGQLQSHLTLEATCIQRSAHWVFRHPLWEG
jgi:hypothetical protein